MTGKVICVGFHKTGTSSLGRALEVLGLKVAGPFGVRDRQIEHRALGQALNRLEHHDAAQDNPWPLLFRELDEAFAGSRFVLTERSEDRWLASVVRHFGGTTTPMREWIYGAGDPLGREQQFLDVYRGHNEAVRAHFSDRPEDLLVMRLEDDAGWAPLCRFLNRPEPTVAFPHANQGSPARRVVNRARGRVRRTLGR